MSDQAPATPDTPIDAPAPVADTPEPQATEPAVNYEQRYSDLRSEFDRRNTLVSRAQQGDAEALAELGFEFYDDTPQQEEPSEFDPFDPDSLQAYIAQQIQQGVQEHLTPFQQQQQQQQVEMQSAAALHAIDGFEQMPEKAQDYVWRIAQTLPPTPDGLYDVNTAYQQFQELNSELQQSWASSKPKGPAPGSGPAATDVPPNLDASPQDLIKWAQEKYRNAGHTA